MRAISLAIVWAGVAAAVAGFFLPWAHIELREPELARQLRQSVPGQELLQELAGTLGRVTAEIRGATETVAGELPRLSEIPRQVSGMQIPQLANQRNAQVAIALIELFTPPLRAGFTNSRQPIGRQSYAVYLVPGLALACGLLVTWLGRRRAWAFGLAALCAAVAGVGFWKLLTTNTQSLFVAIAIGRGVWLSLWGYVLVAVGALVAAAAAYR